MSRRHLITSTELGKDGHAKAERDFKVVKSLDDGFRIISFPNRAFPVLCINSKTYDGVAIGEVVA